MSISFNTSQTANSGGAQTPSQSLTIPAGVLAGDVMILVVEAFSTSTFSPAVLSTGTVFTQVGTTQTGGNASGFVSNGQAWKAVASATDAGKVITAGSTTSFWGLGLAAYTGASGVDPGSAGNAVVSSGTGSIVTPSFATAVAGEWAIQCSPFGLSNPPYTSLPSGTARFNNNASGVGTVLVDSAASVGPAGTTIGGGTFTDANVPSYWLTSFTIGLEPGGSPPPASPGLLLATFP